MPGLAILFFSVATVFQFVQKVSVPVNQALHINADHKFWLLKCWPLNGFKWNVYFFVWNWRYMGILFKIWSEVTYVNTVQNIQWWECIRSNI